MVQDLLHYFKRYTAIYHGNEIPEPKSIFIATAEANNMSATADAKSLYFALMDKVCGGSFPPMKGWVWTRYKWST